ncbi:ATP-binding protein [Sagittula sp. S175]|uniref:ATP-binding protein n=1 Tax=Sagittula sp. S175 TaxID=3415129 RepID=UPI003C7CA973
MFAETLEDDRLSIQGILPSTPDAVTAALRDLRAHMTAVPALAHLDPSWEIVLAEVLNNIVEHAYANCPEGEIRFQITVAPTLLQAEFCDCGRAMPNGAPPQPKPANLDVPSEDLPEGGFGWSLIHALVSRLDYTRSDGHNHLALEMPLR